MPHPELNGSNQNGSRGQNGKVDETVDIAQLAALLGVPPGGSDDDGIDVTEGMPVHLVAPPDVVWAQIAASTGVLVDARPDEVRRIAARASVSDLAPDLGSLVPATRTSIRPVPLRQISLRPISGKPGSPGSGKPGSGKPVSSQPVSSGPVSSGPGSPGGITELETRRRVTTPSAARQRRLEPLITLIAAATLVIGLVGGAGSVLAMQHWGDQGGGAPAVSVLSRAALTGLPDAPAAAGEVDVLKTPTGQQLQVSVRRLGAAEGFYEVWLADAKLDKMIPVGLLQGDEATFDLPGDVNPAGYPTVDISLEPLDGNPAHSSHSVLRGTLSG